MSSQESRELDRRIAEEMREAISSLDSEALQGEEGLAASGWSSLLKARAARARRRRRALLLYSSSAAVVLLLLSLFWWRPHSKGSSLEKLYSDKIRVIEPPTFKESELLLNEESRRRELLKREVTPLSILAYRGARVGLSSVEGDSGLLVAEEVYSGLLASAESDSGTVKEEESIKSDGTTSEEKESATLKGLTTIANGGTPFIEREKREGRSVRFGVNLSSGFNGGAMASIYSAGVSLEVKLGKNLSLSTALLVEQQNVENPKRSENRSLLRSYTKEQSVMTNFDLPLNLTWRFINGRERNWYLSGGISTLAMIEERQKESFTVHGIQARTALADANNSGTLSDYSEGAPATYSVESMEVVEVSSYSPSKNPDLAGRINLIFGVEQKLSPTLNLHIEPFLKIPVVDRKWERVNFTSGGISLRLSF